MDLEKQIGTYDKTPSVKVVEDDSSINTDRKSTKFFKNIIDGFKRADLSDVDTSEMTQAEIQAYLTSKAPLKRSLTSTQISLIAIGGSIGAGLFVGSGGAFVKGGPAGVVIGYVLVSIMIFCTMHSLGELAVRFPIQGAFSQYSTRFLDKSWGFAIGWNYALNYLITFPLELISCTIVLSFWDSDNTGATKVSKAAWASLFYVVCLILNLFGAKGYGSGEAVFSVIKILAVIGFCIFGVVITCGGGPTKVYYGGRYWRDPGAFAHGAKGVFAVFVNAAFSFTGTELAGLAAAETKNPRKALPRAVKQVFWRIVLFYLVSLTIVGFLVPYTNPLLGGGKDGRYSPFVIAIESAGVKGLPSVFNVVICLSVLSVGNACVYASSRTIATLSAQGFAPQFLGYIDREGRPLVGIGVTAVFGLLCFLAATNYRAAFDWMLAISGLCAFFNWGSINLAHIRFRMGMKKQGRSLDELSFRSASGITGSYVGLIVNIVIVCLEFWLALFPIGKKSSAMSFFENYLSVIFIFVFYLLGKCIFKDWSLFIRSSDMDLDSGAREVDIAELELENIRERERIAAMPLWKRAYHFWC